MRPQRTILSETEPAKNLFELPTLFKSISDLKINCSKTEGMWRKNFWHQMTLRANLSFRSVFYL